MADNALYGVLIDVGALGHVDTREYKNAETARCAYRNAIALVRAGGIVRVTCNRNELFLIRNDI